MSLADFVSRYQGQSVCTSPSCGTEGFCECVELINLWACVNGWPTPTGYAACCLNWPSPWQSVATPSPGDVIQFAANLPGSVSAGHVSIYLGPRQSGYVGFDQNWDSPLCEVTQHQSWDYVTGIWHHPQPAAPPPPVPPTPTPSPPAGGGDGGGLLFLLLAGSVLAAAAWDHHHRHGRWLPTGLEAGLRGGAKRLEKGAVRLEHQTRAGLARAKRPRVQ